MTDNGGCKNATFLEYQGFPWKRMPQGELGMQIIITDGIKRPLKMQIGWVTI